MHPDDRRALIRSVRQRLEGLARAGVDRIALPELPAPAPRKRIEKPPARIDEPVPLPPPPPPRLPVPESRPAPVLAASLFEEPTIEEPALSPAERTGALASLAAEVATCVRCPHL